MVVAKEKILIPNVPDTDAVFMGALKIIFKAVEDNESTGNLASSIFSFLIH